MRAAPAQNLTSRPKKRTQQLIARHASTLVDTLAGASTGQTGPIACPPTAPAGMTARGRRASNGGTRPHRWPPPKPATRMQRYCVLGIETVPIAVGDHLPPRQDIREVGACEVTVGPDGTHEVTRRLSKLVRGDNRPTSGLGATSEGDSRTTSESNAADAPDNNRVTPHAVDMSTDGTRVLNEDEVLAPLSPGGSLVSGPGRAYRPQQQRMAAAVLEALTTRRSSDPRLGAGARPPGRRGSHRHRKDDGLPRPRSGVRSGSASPRGHSYSLEGGQVLQDQLLTDIERYRRNVGAVRWVMLKGLANYASVEYLTATAAAGTGTASTRRPVMPLISGRDGSSIPPLRRSSSTAA